MLPEVQMSRCHARLSGHTATSICTHPHRTEKKQIYAPWSVECGVANKSDSNEVQNNSGKQSDSMHDAHLLVNIIKTQEVIQT
jgi:hypothetical protein